MYRRGPRSLSNITTRSAALILVSVVSGCGDPGSSNGPVDAADVLVDAPGSLADAAPPDDAPGASDAAAGDASTTGSDGGIPTCDGFGEPPALWTLPPGFATDQLDELAEDSSGSCVVGSLHTGTLDMTGDGLADLVVADRCDVAGVGTDHWLVYPSTGAGFSPSAMTWPLPGGFATDQLDQLDKDTSSVCGLGGFASATVDLTGDERPDLVIADRCDLAGVGTDHWLVFLNTGAGFSSTATTWSLPPGFGTDHLDRLTKDTSGVCVAGALHLATVDMTGDRRPDLVVTDHCDIAGVGTTHWLVFPNTGAGFATAPIAWSLPPGFATDQIDELNETEATSCIVGAFHTATVDMTGDVRPELVITDDCDIAGVGTTHWLVFSNTGVGFATAAEAWALPAGFATDQLDAIVKDSSGACVVGAFHMATTDMTGDDLPDLTITDNCDIAGVGTDHWRVYPDTGLCP